MTREQVQELLGTPDATDLRTAGTETPNPQPGLVWIYKWQGLSSMRGFAVVFLKRDGEWVVSMWRWLGVDGF